jgi:hypothetical protein
MQTHERRVNCSDTPVRNNHQFKYLDSERLTAQGTPTLSGNHGLILRGMRSIPITNCKLDWERESIVQTAMVAVNKLCITPTYDLLCKLSRDIRELPILRSESSSPEVYHDAS